MSTFTQWNGPEQAASNIVKQELRTLSESVKDVAESLDEHAALSAVDGDDVHGIVEYVASQINSSSEGLLNAYVGLATPYDEDGNEITVSSDYTVLEDTAKLVYSPALASSSFIAGIIHAYDTVDFTKWTLVDGDARTIGSSESGYILGEVSVDWSDQSEDDGAPADTYKNKAARVYIKYVNDSPFDAIADITATIDSSGTWTGSLTVHLSKPASTWANMKFYLASCTSSSGQTHVYLAVSASSAISAYVCGENFIPIGHEDYEKPNGSCGLITSVSINAADTGVTAFDTVNAGTIQTDTINDSTGNSLLVNDDGAITIGDSDVTVSVDFVVRPSVVIGTDDDGDDVTSEVATISDLNDLVPVGTILRWCKIDSDTKYATDVPDGYLATDGSTYNTATYSELYSVLGTSTLPAEYYSMIKAKSTTV